MKLLLQADKVYFYSYVICPFYLCANLTLVKKFTITTSTYYIFFPYLYPSLSSRIYLYLPIFLHIYVLPRHHTCVSSHILTLLDPPISSHICVHPSMSLYMCILPCQHASISSHVSLTHVHPPMSSRTYVCTSFFYLVIRRVVSNQLLLQLLPLVVRN